MSSPIRCWCAVLSVVTFVGAAFLARHADAAKVLGKIQGFRLLQNPVWTEARDPERHGYSFREPVPTVRAEFRRPYPHVPKEVCIAALAEGPQPPPRPILVRVGGGRTTPVTMVVPPGTHITFKNTDAFPHRLYAVGVKTFAPNDTVAGSNREWTPPGPGVFEIRDELSPSLRMWVVADPNVAAIAYPSLKGEFALDVPAAGNYRIQAFFAGQKVGPEIPTTLTDRDVDLHRTPLTVADAKSVKKDKDVDPPPAKEAQEKP